MGEKAALPASKWHKWRIVEKSLPGLQPATAVYTPETLEKFLKRYPFVFIKPDSSYGGKDVIKIQNVVSRFLLSHRNQKKQIFSSLDDLKKWIEDLRGERLFLVQQGISLHRFKNKVADMRTIVQQNERGIWVVTGMFAKTAPVGMVVTNVKAGGVPISVPRYLKGVGLEEIQRKKVIRDIRRLSVRASKILAESCGNKIFGLDIGLDESGRLWLIEMNTKPSLRILKRISKKMYLRSRDLYVRNHKAAKSKAAVISPKEAANLPEETAALPEEAADPPKEEASSPKEAVHSSTG